jgi:hypothetical protein
MGLSAIGAHALGVRARGVCCALRGADWDEGAKVLVGGHRHPKDGRDGQ